MNTKETFLRAFALALIIVCVSADKLFGTNLDEQYSQVHVKGFQKESEK